MSVPQVDCILLVPKAICGGKPAASNAGTEINPPPPAMASMNPALSPARKRSAMISQVMNDEASSRKRDEFQTAAEKLP
jgi:hypothetical protein